jgi:hypothetical protein
MKRRRFKAMLEKAELHLFEGAWRIARQKELIAEMSYRGVDVSSYLALLTSFEETQRLQIKHVYQIKRELYDPLEHGGELHSVDPAPSYPPAASLTEGKGDAESPDHLPEERRTKGGEADADCSDGSFHHPHDKRRKDGCLL